jgi:PleD family two-component response regulator
MRIATSNSKAAESAERYHPLSTLTVTPYPGEEETPGAKPSVLVVDDEAAVAMVLARGLTYAGYDAVVAGSGQEALDRLAEKSFDVLLTDIHMPSPARRRAAADCP